MSVLLTRDTRVVERAKNDYIQNEIDAMPAEESGSEVSSRRLRITVMLNENAIFAVILHSVECNVQRSYLFTTETTVLLAYALACLRTRALVFIHVDVIQVQTHRYLHHPS